MPVRGDSAAETASPLTEKRRIEAIRKINISSENKLAYDQNRPSRFYSNNSGLGSGMANIGNELSSMDED